MHLAILTSEESIYAVGDYTRQLTTYLLTVVCNMSREGGFLPLLSVNNT